MTRFLHLFATFLILAPLLVGGASSLPPPKRDEKPPVPYLNPDGSVPSNFQNHKVFLDPVSGNAVVRFDSDANSNRKNSKMIAVELARHIDPKVEVMVDYDPDSRLWHYVYTLENGSSARQAAVSWYFKGLTDKTVSSIEVPEEWHYLFPSVLGSPNWPRLVIAATWGPGKTILTIGVKPGGRIHELEFKSVLAPALADVYAQGGAHYASFPAEPPQELQKVWGFPYNFRKAQTLIPAMDSSVTIQQLSGQYIEELRKCQADNLCSADFSENAIAFLARQPLKAEVNKPLVNKLLTAAELPLDKQYIKIFQSRFFAEKVSQPSP